MNGNETGGPSLLLKTKSGFKETKVPRPKAQENEETNYPPILHKPQFKRPAAGTADRQLTKVSQSTIMGGSEMPHIGIKLNTLKSRKPFLSVQIPNPAPQSSPVLRDIPMFDRNASTVDYPISALHSREASTATFYLRRADTRSDVNEIQTPDRVFVNPKNILSSLNLDAHSKFRCKGRLSYNSVVFTPTPTHLSLDSTQFHLVCERLQFHQVPLLEYN